MRKLVLGEALVDEGANGGGIQPLESELATPSLARQLMPEPDDRMLCGDGIDGSIGADDQEPPRLATRRQGPQEADGGMIAPV